MRYILPCIASTLLLTACGNMIQPGRTETFVHPGTSFHFPPVVANFERQQVTSYDSNGQDFGVGYNHRQPPIAVTIYVYPIPSIAPHDSLEGHFAACKSAALSHENAKLIEETSAKISPNGRSRMGKHATFTFTEVFANQRQPVQSELFLFRQGTRYIKYRATYPIGQSSAAKLFVRNFMNQLSWP